MYQSTESNIKNIYTVSCSNDFDSQENCDKIMGRDSSMRKTSSHGIAPLSVKLSGKFGIYKNLIVTSIAYVIQYTSFHGIATLQSSINSRDGLGTISLAVYFSGTLISNLLLPTIVIRYLGYKWTMIIGLLMYTPYVVVQLWPSFWAFVPMAFLAGMSTGPLWCANFLYFTVLAQSYASITDEPKDKMVAKFFTTFYAIFSFSDVGGTYLTAAILLQGKTDVTTLQSDGTCGIHFCPHETFQNNTNLERPPEDRLQLLFFVCLGCMLAAGLIIFLFVDKATRFEGTKAGVNHSNTISFFLRSIVSEESLLLLPVTFFQGAVGGFRAADFTQAYVACSWGIGHIGYVLMVYGLSGCLCNLLVGLSLRVLKRTTLIAIGYVAWLCTLAALMALPHPEEDGAFYVIATAWALADSCFNLIKAHVSLMFPAKQVQVYSSLHLWGGVGGLAAMAYSTRLCTMPKLLILLGVLLVSLGSCCMLEFRFLRKTRRVETLPTTQGTNPPSNFTT